MTQTETLAASLAATNTGNSLYLDDGRYIDWSGGASTDDDSRQFELGDDDGAYQITLTREEMLALHAALTATLIRTGS